MKKLFIGMLAVVISLSISSCFLVRQTFAANCGGVPTSIIECGKDDGIDHILNLVIDILSVGVGIFGVIGISIVGIQYLTSSGNEEQARKAKRRIYEIIIGLAVYVVFYAILAWLGIKK